APYAPASILVPSTSTYPSKIYTSLSKVPVSQFIDDFLHWRIELRDAHSGQGLDRIAHIVSFQLDFRLAWRIARTFVTTTHSEHQDKHNMQRYVLQNDSLLEQILGPDRLPLVGYIRDDVPEQLETNLGIQMERIGKEYLDLNPDDRLLDVNAQWGDLAVYLAHDYQVPTCAIVATSSQLAHASNVSGESQVQRFMRFVTGDYRAIPQCLPPGMPLFTKVLAFDALDTVGPRNIAKFLLSINAVMERGGRLLLQVTTTPSSLGRGPLRTPSHLRFKADSGGRKAKKPLDATQELYDSHVPNGSLDSEQYIADDFSSQGQEEWSEHWWYHWFRQRYIQPGTDTSMLVSIEQVMSELQRAGFEVHQVESLTTDAAMTTAVWCTRLCAAKRQIEMELGADTYRAWELYLNWTQSLYARA
ncbi:Cyclopropane-fatty-acyl-phospholipid synthase, partial [Coemansia sp. RSA 2598]